MHKGVVLEILDWFELNNLLLNELVVDLWQTTQTLAVNTQDSDI